MASLIAGIAPVPCPPSDPPDLSFRVAPPPVPPDPPPDTRSLIGFLRLSDLGTTVIFPHKFSDPKLCLMISYGGSASDFSMATKKVDGGGAPMPASYIFFAYGFLSPVLYRSLLGWIDWPSISSCFHLPITPPLCSSLTGSILDVGVVFVYLSSWWQVEEKLIVILIPFVPRWNQSSFLVFHPLLWSELDEQVSLVCKDLPPIECYSMRMVQCVWSYGLH